MFDAFQNIFATHSDTTMEITYYGHSSFMVKTNGKNILFDPFISPNPLASDIDVDALKPDFVLLSHGHIDHVEDAPRICKNAGSTAIGSWETMVWMEKQGVEKTHPMNIGGSWNFDFGNLKLVNAVHSSSMPDGSYGGNPTGFVVSNNEDCFYYAGDTALHMDMQLIPRRCNIKTAFLPIGSNFTMDVYDAIEAARMIHCNNIIGMHYDTFDYIKIDHSDALDAFTKAGIYLHLLNIGQTVNF